MKKIIASFLIMGCIQLNAQENKGKWIVNGSVNYSQSNNKGTDDSYNPRSNSKSGRLGVNLGYFITNNFALGLSNSYSLSKEETIYTGYAARTERAIRSSYTPGIFAKYNHSINKSKFGFFLQLDANFSLSKRISKVNDPYQNTITKDYYSRLSTSLTPGIIYFINQKFSVQTSFGNVSFSSAGTRGKKAVYLTENQFSFNFSPFVTTFGFTYYFGGNKSEDKKTNE